MEKKRFSLKEVVYFLSHRPLVIVQLEHSSRNKRLIVQALRGIYKDDRGPVIIENLRVFLRERACKYDLTPDQRGARDFLLREISSIQRKPRGIRALAAAIVPFGSST